MKPGRILLILSILFVAVIIYLNKCNNGNTEKVTAKGAGSQQAMNVSGLIVNPQTVEEKIYSTGTLAADAEVELKNEIAGKSTAILFKEGSRVLKNQRLVTVYDDDLKEQYRKLELQLELAARNEERQKDLLGINGI